MGYTKRRMALYILGLFLLGMGVAFSIQSALGVSAVSSVPYIFSKIVNLSVGTLTFFLYCILVVAQMVILRGDFKSKDLLQVLFSFVAGFFTDLSLFLISGLVPSNYFQQLLFTVIGIVILSIAIFLLLVTDIVYNAPEGLCAAINQRWGIKFSKAKTMLDITSVTISIIFSLIYIGDLSNIREGTIICALTIGKLAGVLLEKYKDPVIHFYTKDSVEVTVQEKE